MHCCYIYPENDDGTTQCDEEAQYEIRDGKTVDDYSHSCVKHVGYLLRDDHTPVIIYPI